MAPRATAVLGAVVALAACLALIGIAQPAAQAAQGPVYLASWNGHNYRVGSDDLNTGTAVKQVCSTCGRQMFWEFLGWDSQSREYGYWKFSNGNFMASNNDCTGITIKGSASSNGVVWTIIIGDYQPFYLANRYCSGYYLSADNTLGHQWKTKAPGANGWYQKLYDQPA